MPTDNLVAIEAAMLVSVLTDMELLAPTLILLVAPTVIALRLPSVKYALPCDAGGPPIVIALVLLGDDSVINSEPLVSSIEMRLPPAVLMRLTLGLVLSTTLGFSEFG